MAKPRGLIRRNIPQFLFISFGAPLGSGPTYQSPEGSPLCTLTNLCRGDVAKLKMGLEYPRYLI